ncbi:metal ABC transporter solute-binding protein, Zn/Mn family [Fervidibacillus albus]|uniref:Zinc ABC transporter substrate-binding protein n=1 Tax=Fervidibacillus albus TaxID=2980026 RepID=A0A9E8RY05_9BACI|nr:zinc ABC transporter substrate-binding protein [Fervidibacillus albus]WAA10112.1 zinc ABC transporter substrate-binding protein [Fervidibacillus albus]
MKKKAILLFSILATLFVLSACGQSAEEGSGSSDGDKPVVAVSIVPQQTWVEAVVGDFAEVAVMIPPGKSPANYAPSPQELQLFSDASVYFSIGVPTESVNILSKTEDINPEMKIVQLDQVVSETYPDRTFASGERDQHIWLSPKRAALMVQEIADVLSEQFPEEKENFQANAESYIKKIEEVDENIKTLFSNVEKKPFIVYHPAFGYFADEYGLEMISIEQEGKDASPQQLQEIIDLAKEEEIQVIFYQAEIDSSQTSSMAEEIGGKTEQLVPLASNYIENLLEMAEKIKESWGE